MNKRAELTLWNRSVKFDGSLARNLTREFTCKYSGFNNEGTKKGESVVNG